MKEYVMTKRVLTRLKRTRLDVVCTRCHEQIKEGDSVVVMENRTKCPRVIRHKKCQEELYI